MLVLKLQRVGKKHQASFRLVVGEKRTKLNGKQLEYLGWHNPHSHQSKLNKDRILHWLGVGAQKTDTVHNLLVNQGIIAAKKISAHKRPKKVAANVSVDKS